MAATSGRSTSFGRNEGTNKRRKLAPAIEPENDPADALPETEDIWISQAGDL